MSASRSGRAEKRSGSVGWQLGQIDTKARRDVTLGGTWARGKVSAFGNSHASRS